jgi:HSP20 family protein
MTERALNLPNRAMRMPAVDVLERAEEIVISVDLPGLTADDVEVTVDKDRLILRGERSFEEAAEGESYRRVERMFGTFERTFKLSDLADPDRIEARFSNGVMTVIVPKREEIKPRTVEISVEAN